MTRNVEAVFFILLASLGILFAVFIVPTAVPSGSNQGAVTPSFFPLLSITIIVIFSIIEALSIIKKKDKTEIIKFWGRGEAKKALILTITFLLYIFIGINTLGFYLSSTLLLMGVIWYLGVNRLWIIPIISIAVVFFIHYLFSIQLGIEFPRGMFF